VLGRLPFAIDRFSILDGNNSRRKLCAGNEESRRLIRRHILKSNQIVLRVRASQKVRTLPSNRKFLKRKLIDIESHIRDALRAYGLLIGAVARGRYEAGIREPFEHCDPIFAATIEAMLDLRRAIF
jgi:hypothetical protein